MSNKALIIFCILILGSHALPMPETEDMSIFFENVSPNTRIVGGKISENNAHPHMVSLLTGTVTMSFLCGGSIITPWTILTAAHCITPIYSNGSIISSARLSIGSNIWDYGLILKIAGNATHAEYSSRAIKNDIAMLFTETAIGYTNRIKPITISYEFVEAGIDVMAIGWGRKSVNGRLSSLIREIELKTVDGLACKEEVARSAIIHNMRPPAVNPELQVCTLHEQGAGFGMCRGDSGSSLFRMDTREQIGLVSWGLPCALGAPDMFVRLSVYKDWIAEHIKE